MISIGISGGGEEDSCSAFDRIAFRSSTFFLRASISATSFVLGRMIVRCSEQNDKINAPFCPPALSCRKYDTDQAGVTHFCHLKRKN